MVRYALFVRKCFSRSWTGHSLNRPIHQRLLRADTVVLGTRARMFGVHSKPHICGLPQEGEPGTKSAYPTVAFFICTVIRIMSQLMSPRGPCVLPTALDAEHADQRKKEVLGLL